MPSSTTRISISRASATTNCSATTSPRNRATRSICSPARKTCATCCPGVRSSKILGWLREQRGSAQRTRCSRRRWRSWATTARSSACGPARSSTAGSKATWIACSAPSKPAATGWKRSRPARTCASIPARGRAYLPTASYMEMTEWALPAEQMHEIKQLRLDMEREIDSKQGERSRSRRLHAPHPALHARRLLAQLPRQISRSQPDAEARHVHQPPHPRPARRRRQKRRAAGICGRRSATAPTGTASFGGIYLFHIRAANYANLLDAEALILDDKVQRRTGRFRPRQPRRDRRQQQSVLVRDRPGVRRRDLRVGRHPQPLQPAQHHDAAARRLSHRSARGGGAQRRDHAGDAAVERPRMALHDPRPRQAAWAGTRSGGRLAPARLADRPLPRQTT